MNTYLCGLHFFFFFPFLLDSQSFLSGRRDGSTCFLPFFLTFLSGSLFSFLLLSHFTNVLFLVHNLFLVTFFFFNFPAVFLVFFSPKIPPVGRRTRSPPVRPPLPIGPPESHLQTDSLSNSLNLFRFFLGTSRLLFRGFLFSPLFPSGRSPLPQFFFVPPYEDPISSLFYSPIVISPPTLDVPPLLRHSLTPSFLPPLFFYQIPLVNFFFPFLRPAGLPSFSSPETRSSKTPSLSQE